MNALFALDKPAGITSNRCLAQFKRRARVRSAGFSGILDPFATGCLVVATEHYTRLLPWLDLEPKIYRATLWLGAQSPTLDTEAITRVHHTHALDAAQLPPALAQLCALTQITPPAFSARRVGGVRAYERARRGESVVLEPMPITVFEAQLCHYAHPFVTFTCRVSKGTYIRVLGAHLARMLGVEHAALSALHRVCEGSFVPGDERPLDPIKHLRVPILEHGIDAEDLRCGRILRPSLLEWPQPIVALPYDGGLAIVEHTPEGVRYRLNLAMEGAAC